MQTLRDKRQVVALDERRAAAILDIATELYCASYNIFNLSKVDEFLCFFSKKKRQKMAEQKRKELLVLSKKIIDSVCQYETMMPVDDFPLAVMTSARVKEIVRT